MLPLVSSSNFSSSVSSLGCTFKPWTWIPLNLTEYWYSCSEGSSYMFPLQLSHILRSWPSNGQAMNESHWFKGRVPNSKGTLPIVRSSYPAVNRFAAHMAPASLSWPTWYPMGTTISCFLRMSPYLNIKIINFIIKYHLMINLISFFIMFDKYSFIGSSQ